MDEKYLMEVLDKSGLSKELCDKSKKLYQMRVILIDKYIHLMSREEICAELDFISLRTYNYRLKQALLKIKNHL